MSISHPALSDKYKLKLFPTEPAPLPFDKGSGGHNVR